MNPAENLPEGFQAGYLTLLESGELEQRVRIARQHLKSCDLCARYCRVDRLRTTQGAVCRTGERAVVYSYGPHYGEEDVLRGWNGSGTIFFSWCNLRCEFCQNWEISQKGEGREVEPDELAAMMLDLQARGCHNINFVTPSHVVAQILEATLIAARRGLTLRLVYNTAGYDSPEALALLDGIIDIYMPDMKYGDSVIAHRYSHVRNYWEVNRAAVKEMYRQVGNLRLAENGLAYRGLLVRHLILPAGLAGTEKVLKFIAREISTETYVNLMGQYYPGYRASDLPELSRRIAATEYREVLDIARRLGLTRQDRPSPVNRLL
ncbi:MULTISPECIES: radical SAM protein [Methylocaldum]|jgi:putative pyruvate formate lyase activating enzyme|uniref:radical SAM protein n=1 Tax=unclassified Methylocaldum TaxID=2622260 RepID=UPI00098A826B|nr:MULTISPECIES: radical SAM protein [unclassified Methylocaldum]MBP1152878.1 putative pyruvate formate lyase activating enzyme [Methylocaldum sp. RMAD-M]MVF23915.1 radical SAM protein [Methylocaldum sp. BRCS4]